jgi:FLVCR family MFS transporter 7
MEEQYRTYQYRWVILAAIIPVIVSSQIFWLSLSPVSKLAAAYYSSVSGHSISSFAIDIFTTSYLIMFILFTFPASWVIDKYGYRVSLIIGSAMLAVFGVMRAVFAANFTLAIIFQFAVAAGQPFLLNISTKVPANWFPVSERSIAAGLLTMAQYLGFIVPMVLSPILVDPGGLGENLIRTPAQVAIPELFKVYAIIAVACAIVAVALTKERPRIAPGPEAEKEVLSVRSIFRLFMNGAFCFVLIIVFVSMGVFNTLLTCIDSILGSRGLGTDGPGIVGAIFVVCGVIGAVVLPIISDKTRIRTPLFIAAISLLVPMYIGLTFFHDFTLLCITAALAGFAIMGVAPIIFQHGAEVAYPVKEGTSFGVIILSGQISGALFIVLYNALTGATGSILPPMLLFVGLTALQIPFAARMKESKILLELREGKR